MDRFDRLLDLSGDYDEAALSENVIRAVEGRENPLE